MKTTLLITLVITSLGLASGPGPLKTYEVNGQPATKVQAVLAGLKDPSASLLECNQVRVDPETLRLKRVKAAKKQSND